jgi:hypothetical protein
MPLKKFPIFWDDLTVDTQRRMCEALNTDEDYESDNSQLDPLFIIERETND